ncbi:MAG TPA: Ig domain-containing protein, partial [Ferruginibacter sp.]|nr:Ig domain-containing protein [Ferruginibacter sp.]
MQRSMIHVGEKLKFLTICLHIVCFIQLGFNQSVRAQNVLFAQGFEGVCDNWNYSGGVVSSNIRRNGSNSGRVGNTNSSLTFESANLNGYAGMVLTIYHGVQSGSGPGMDTREGAVIQISLNGGPFTTIAAVSGFGDASWNFNTATGGAATGSSGCTIYNAPNPVVYNIPNGTTSIQVRVVSVRAGTCAAFNTAMNNATPSLYDRSDEGFYIDDISITTTTPLPPNLILTSAVTTSDQDLITCTPTPIDNITYATSAGGATVTGLPPGVSFSNNNGTLTISGTPTVNGSFNYTVTDVCTGETATGNITRQSIVPAEEIIQTISSCSPVVYKGITYSSSTLAEADTLLSIGGCDSVFQKVNIIITPVVPVEEIIQTINSCSPVLYKGITYNSSTLAEADTLLSIGGCDSVWQKVNIIITPVVPVEEIIQTISSC